MCGIAAQVVFGQSSSSISMQEMARVLRHMHRRGPDGSDTWLSPDRCVALGHVRLAIIDLDQRAAQPMKSSCGNYVVSFNGEIYNYQALRTQLKEKGIKLNTDSDTEVLLGLYRLHGAKMLSQLRGMFAFTLYDVQNKTLFAARDAFGIKPLYYYQDVAGLRFCSQVKPIAECCAIDAETESAGLVGFFLFGSVPEPYTNYKKIKSLPAGHCMEIDVAAGRVAISKYTSIAQWYCDAESATEAPRDIQRQVREELLDSVRHHMIADVKVGMFLSSGIDSCALLGLARDLGCADLTAMTISFDEFRHSQRDESPLAAVAAKRYGYRHHVRSVSEKEFLSDLESILQAMDQPSIDGINAWYTAKFAKELGLKVAISGLGGDELFGGYPSFSQLPRWSRLANTVRSIVPFRQQVATWFALASRHTKRIPPKLPGLISMGETIAGAYIAKRALFMPWELTELLPREMIVDGLSRLNLLSHVESSLDPCPRMSHAKISTLEATHYMKNQLLRDADWAGMAHSIEIRVPLVDQVLWQKIAKSLLLTKEKNKKFLLAGAPHEPLPQAISHRPKTGFETPIANWMCGVSQGESGLKTAHWSRKWAQHIFRTTAHRSA